MGQKGSSSFFILLIGLGISVVIIILNFVWLFPVMTNSKNDEPSLETRISLVETTSINYNEGQCSIYLEGFLNEGAHETFNFKIKTIHKFSTGLISLFFIQIIISILFVIFLIIFSVKNLGDAGAILFIIYYLLDLIISILNLIFFIILSVNYYKGKYDDFEDFGDCEYFEPYTVSHTYDYIFTIKKNYKKFFLMNIILLSLNSCSTFLKTCCRSKE